MASWLAHWASFKLAWQQPWQKLANWWKANKHNMLLSLIEIKGDVSPLSHACLKKKPDPSTKFRCLLKQVTPPLLHGKVTICQFQAQPWLSSSLMTGSCCLHNLEMKSVSRQHICPSSHVILRSQLVMKIVQRQHSCPATPGNDVRWPERSTFEGLPS